MASSLSCVGVLWAFLSLTAAILCCTGFYVPFWIQGRLMDKVDAYFGSFRRCNYPRVTSGGVVEIVQECGRYSNFKDIPSVWWQVTTILAGAGSAITLIVAVTAISACCVSYVIHPATAKLAGAMQFIAAALVLVGVAIYPMGWDNREVRESCGNLSNVYKLGTCQLSWSLYLLSAAVIILLLCFSLSFCAARVVPPEGSFRI
uniref:Lipoma HMGIC fusion partner homolog n=1 Tax=Cacopsylla melanoneura TaxID=428564 RepID=A0A8D8X4D5_9HEMI